MVVVLLQTPVSVSLAGGVPIALVVSLHLLLPVLCCFYCIVLLWEIIIDPVLDLLVAVGGACSDLSECVRTLCVV